ncbi:MAG: hypothetical protein R3E42_07845 [Burkholderiaceae bacterium]
MKTRGMAWVKQGGLLAVALGSALGLGGCAQLGALTDSLNVFGSEPRRWGR